MFSRKFYGLIIRTIQIYFIKILISSARALLLYSQKHNDMKTTATTHSTKRIEALGNAFDVTVARGASNYVNIRKITNNPFKGPGKDFPNFDAAVAAYKSAEMKGALLMIEMGF